MTPKVKPRAVATKAILITNAALLITIAALATLIGLLSLWFVFGGKPLSNIKAQNPKLYSEAQDQTPAVSASSAGIGKVTGSTDVLPVITEIPKKQLLDNHPEDNQPLVNNTKPSNDDAIQVHYVRARANAQSGVSSFSKRQFDIPAGWQLMALKVIQKQGRVRVFEQNNQVIVEAHALTGGEYSRAFANVKITLEKIHH